MLALALLGGASSASAAVCFVKTTGLAANSGASWSQPKDLPSALNAASCDDIRVARGVYKPPATPTPGADLTLRRGVEVYGGFEGLPGSENDFASRNPKLNPTVISGDIGGDDIVNGDGVTVSHADVQGINRYLFSLEPGNGQLGNDSVLDGFILTAAQAWALMCSVGPGPGECSPTLRNLVWIGNQGTLFLVAGSGGRVRPLLVDSTFRNNTASFDSNGTGAVVYVLIQQQGLVAPRFSNVTFHNNLASYGGVFGVESSGGTFTGRLDHATLAGNSAALSGGVAYMTGTESTASLEFTNSVIWGNTAPSEPVFHHQSYRQWATVRASVLQGGCPVGYTFCTDIATGDPLLGPLQDNGGYTPTLLPGAGGSAIDHADLADCLPADQRGVTRPQGAGCDAGAVESTDPLFRYGFEG